MLPIVLHHGIFGYDRMRFGPWQWCYFGGGIDQEIAARGHPLIVARVSRTGAIAERAEQLKQTVLDQLDLFGRPSDRVIILAHSMGGLDARYMIHKLEMAHRVAALITLSTPHRGSSYADYMLRNIDKSKRAQQLLRFLGLDLAGVRDLTVDALTQFNDQILDHPDVAYFSVSAARPWHRVPAFLVHSHHIVSRNEGPNDGIVSVKSAQWGTHLGTWPADHMHVVNRRLVLEIRQRTGNVRKRYAHLLDHLCGCGIIPASAPIIASA
jgi:triacylglycerol lipase